MRFLLADTFWALDLLNPFEWHLLSKLPDAASGLELPPETRERLFPPLLSPDTLADEETVSMADDWTEFVRPEIGSRFESERDLVESDLSEVVWIEEEPDLEFQDLEHAPPDPSRLAGERHGRVTVPLDHTDAWYSTLNQARLMMHETHRLADSEERLFLAAERGDDDTDIDRERLYLVAQYEFYSALQTLLVEHAMKP